MSGINISKNTLYVHIPQHIALGIALFSVFTGASSPLWLLVTYFSWVLLGYFGFSVFYHRYFAHQAFKVNRFWHILWGYLGLLVGRGSPLNMASLHCAEHHRYADTPQDPHSPRQGMLWSWFLWAENHHFKVSPQFTKHLIKDNFVRFLDRHYLKIFWVSFFILALINWKVACFGMMGAGAVHFHIEGAVSTFCHLPQFGTKDFETNDDSRNIRGIFNYITLGTGLHNTHHAFPKSYHYAIKKGDFDLAKYAVPLFIKES